MTMARLVAWFIELRNRFNEPRLPKVSTIYVLNRVGDLAPCKSSSTLFISIHTKLYEGALAQFENFWCHFPYSYCNNRKHAASKPCRC